MVERSVTEASGESPQTESIRDAALRDIDERVEKIDAEIGVTNRVIEPLQQERRRFTVEVDLLEKRQSGGERLNAGEQERMKLFQNKIGELSRDQRARELDIREMEARKEVLVARRKDIEGWQ